MTRECPGIVSGAIDFATAGGLIEIYQGLAHGESMVPSCPQSSLAFPDPQETTTIMVSEDGTAEFEIEAQDCGAVILQAVDLASCAVSNTGGY